MKISHVIKTLITSDFFMAAGFAVFSPVFAVFVTQQIDGASLRTVGFAAAIAQIFKVIFQIPIARYLDRNHGEYDDFYSLIGGSSLVALVPFLYFFASHEAHIYFIQALYGIGLAMAVPPWYAIFTRHIDHLKENVEWSLESVGIGIASSLAAAIGGVLASQIGFRYVFLLGGVLTIVGMVFQIFIYKELRAKVSRGMVKPQPDRAA